jgi:hypothetical protein
LIGKSDGHCFSLTLLIAAGSLLGQSAGTGCLIGETSQVEVFIYGNTGGSSFCIVSLFGGVAIAGTVHGNSFIYGPLRNSQNLPYPFIEDENIVIFDKLTGCTEETTESLNTNNSVTFGKRSDCQTVILESIN